MASDLFFYELLLLGLLWLCVMLHSGWRGDCSAGPQRPSTPAQPPRKRSRDPKPFPGLTHKPCCVACEQAVQAPAAPPLPAPPPPITSTRGRPRQVDTSQHFCPNPDCAYQGRVGLGNLSSNGHPSGGHWRQLYCSQCEGYVLETHGTIFYGKRVPVELIVRVVACLAEGLGIRGTARVFEIDPNTVLNWLVEAANQLRAFSQSFLHDLHLRQVQLDELYAMLSAVREGDMSEAEAVAHLSRSPHWVWTAIDPETKLLLSVQVGERTLAMAPCLVHQVTQVLAPRCVPLRQPVAAIGRRSATPCKSETGLCQQLVLFQVYHNFVLPHARLRQPSLAPEPTNGSGSARRWRSCMPAMAAGLTDRVWTLREVLMFRVPPWLQPQAL